MTTSFQHLPLWRLMAAVFFLTFAVGCLLAPIWIAALDGIDLAVALAFLATSLVSLIAFGAFVTP